ncbi:ABC transporter substrate-binding protein [Pseudonocardia sp. GCM10023141]|uniref:ABC transporter substrate-binding protein n=1 Tax=Pseudonocardia sp. GCM10023141 TaxID=3252653 RepID=UPI00361CE39F
MGKYIIQAHHRLHEWIAHEKGYFTEAGLDYEFQEQSLAGHAKQTSAVQSADSVPAEVRSGAFEDMSAGRACDVSSACHWAVNGATAAGAGKMWGHAYSVTPAGIFVAPDSPLHRPEDLAGVPVAVGYHSGSHYAAVQALEPFMEPSQVTLNFSGLPNDRVRLLLRGEVPVANLFGPQYYIAEQLGFRKIVDSTFMVGFLVAGDADPDDTTKYFAALRRAQIDIDLQVELYKKYWLPEMPEDLRDLVDVRRFGPGERMVFEPYTKEMYDTTQRWMDAHGLLDLDDKTSRYQEVVLT